MLDILLEILAIIGIVLLVLLAVLLTVLLLVLFLPIRYRAFGSKNPEAMKVWVKADWLFGFLRLRYEYPEPGNAVARVLWFTLYDSSRDSAKKSRKQEQSDKTDTDKGEALNEEALNTENLNTESTNIESTNIESTNNQSQSELPVESEQAKMHDDSSPREMGVEDSSQQEGRSRGIKQWFFAKYEKIKYTILKLYDKIKHIWENIQFYKTLLQDEQTVGLLRHGWFRLGKILKNIRPRRIKGQLLFGTGAPDTTGYAYGVYGMLLPYLGKHIYVTPDFTRAVLEGELYIAGHITVFQLLYHSLRVILDKRLQLLRHRLKMHRM